MSIPRKVGRVRTAREGFQVEKCNEKIYEHRQNYGKRVKRNESERFAYRIHPDRARVANEIFKARIWSKDRIMR